MKENNELSSNGSIEKYKDKVLNNINDKIDTIKKIEYHYNLKDLFNDLKNLSLEQKERTYESIINSQLETISKHNFDDITTIKKKHDIGDIQEFFSYSFFSKNEEENNQFCAIEEEAEYVADDLIAKVCGKNGRSISLPISLSNIKNYCIHSVVSEDGIDKTILWIILDLSIICSYLNN